MSEKAFTAASEWLSVELMMCKLQDQMNLNMSYSLFLITFGTKIWIDYLDGSTRGTTSCGADLVQRGSVFTVIMKLLLNRLGTFHTVNWV